ncbi:MAG: DUF5723 family protein [Bacteroidales bacterium]
MKKYLLSWLVSIAAVLSATQAVAQTDFTLYHMQLVPYRIYQNPALMPQCRSFVGTPVISSIYFQTSNAFSYSDVISREANDSIKIDIDKLTSKLNDGNNLFMNLDIDLLSFGFKAADKYYITFSARERSIVRFMYPKDLINFLWKGNAAVGLGKTLEFSPRLDAMLFDEYALGFAGEVNEHLTLGTRLKFLNGRANVYTERANASLYTDPVDFSYKLKSDILIRTAGIDSMSDQKTNDIIMGGNHGLGIDIGASYKLNSKFSFSASVLDLGYINWKKQLFAIESRRPGEEINFIGVDINEFINKDTIRNAFQAVIDSLTDKFKIDSVYNQAYKTYLPMRLYAGADFNINDKNTVGILFHGQFYDKKLIPAFSLSYYTQLGRFLGFSASYNIMNKSYNNVGVGLSLNAGPMQIYATTDNILAFSDYKTARNVNVHSGLVWTFGRNKKDKDKDGIIDKLDECPLIPGPKKFNGCPDTDLDSIPDKDDACPNVPGTLANRGCPDRDGDGIYDQDDACPDVPGLLEFKGCPDTDGDGITDANDDCPDVKGLALFRGCPDSDGDSIIDKYDECPYQAGTAVFKGCPDTDGDGIPDKNDLCPTVPGNPENKGCPFIDTDGDGIKDSEDACPSIPGPLENKGCPLLDTDGDKTPDIYDNCPTIPGIPENKGCPEIKKEEQEVINTAFSSLEFETGKSIIKSVSNSSLDRLADLLIKKPDWKLQLSGHTDNVGQPATNMTLSKNRTLAVKKYLTNKGVTDERIKTEWYGQTKPIAPNSTPEGRQKNRRVEIAIFFQ